MARPVETTDDELLDAAGQVLMAQGPSAFTLARVAEVAGVSAATLVKRFGSKDAILLRLSQRWVASLDGQLTVCATAHQSPLARLRAVALHNYHDLDRPDTAAMQLAALAVDLQHAGMRDLLHHGWSRVRAHLAAHAAEAAAAGELVDSPPPHQLARIIAGAMEGGCLAWSVHPEESLITRLGDDLDALVSGWTRAQGSTTTTERKKS